MSDQPQAPRFSLGGYNILGVAEAVAGIVLAVVVFVRGSSPTVDVAGILAALHGLGHGLKTH